MSTETALPTGDTAEAGEQSTTDAAVVEQTEQQLGPDGQPIKLEEPPKKEKTQEQRDRERDRRRIDNLTRQKWELRNELDQLRGGRQQAPREEVTQASDDGESVTLTRAELQKQVEEQARKLAPSISEQREEVQRRQGVVKSLEKQWGKDEFDAKAFDLDEAFGGLADAQGRPKPATDAIFDADNPKALIEFLTDPDNADEAERIAHLPALRAGREIARLEQKLKEEAGKAKPKPSNAAKPLEPAGKGGGVSTKDPSQMTDSEFAAWRKGQIAKRN